MEIERVLVVADPEERKQIWEFYDKELGRINEDTPLAQTWPKRYLIAWLKNPRVIKFIARDRETDEIVGLGIVTDQLKLDWLLSPAYFKKHFPGRQVFHFPVLAVSTRFQRSGVLAVELLRAMIAEVPKDGCGVSLYSKLVNPSIPALAEIAMRGRIHGIEVDAEGCTVYKWVK